MADTVITTTPPLVATWREIIRSGNPPEGAHIDTVSRWLLITRACVFSMTLTSAGIGGLLAAATAANPNWLRVRLKKCCATHHRRHSSGGP